MQGWWRRSTETKRIHFAEELNEYNHLLIMESLGGDQVMILLLIMLHINQYYLKYRNGSQELLLSMRLLFIFLFSWLYGFYHLRSPTILVS